MKSVPNIGTHRVLDVLSEGLLEGAELDLATQHLSLFAYSALSDKLAEISQTRLLIPAEGAGTSLLGTAADRGLRNQLRSRFLARQCRAWLASSAKTHTTRAGIPQGLAVTSSGGGPVEAVLGSFSFSTEGLGIAPGNPLSIIERTESSEEAERLAAAFNQLWTETESADETAPDSIIKTLSLIASLHAPAVVYAAILSHVFGSEELDLDDERVINAATGIKETEVWKKLYKFQRDGVVGAIDKLDRFGGCIIADSVGLGKTFEALAVIKYHELRNDRVLVLAPKRLRENWTLYASNDRRNVLAGDRFNYDVLNHTDLSRTRGKSGDIDLANINWGNYDLVVIDESHNFRNKRSPKKDGEDRYHRLMRQIIKEGVRTRVLMLSATPVNNRLADLRNQIVFATEGNDAALASEGIRSIDATTRLAQKQFNRWLKLEESERTSGALIEALGFDYFTLLDRLTIARSRRHLEKYYGTLETGEFPKRLKPINIKCDIDLEGALRPIAQINQEIGRLSLAAYAPLRYVLSHKKDEYDLKYSTPIGDGSSIFKQADREESMINLLRINMLKRLESAVSSFALTLERQLKKVDEMIARLDDKPDEVEELAISDVDLGDPDMESQLVGSKIKVLLKDVDFVRWRQDLVEDRDRLRALLASVKEVDADRDAKLAELREMITAKCTEPINAENRKLIVFTAFSDTATYLYDNLAGWAKQQHGLESALVTGSTAIRTSIKGMHKDMGTVLSAFSPRSKERPDDMAGEGEIDLLIATDCVSEGQNLQDCDWVINYDIHWNPVRIVQRFGRIDRLGSINDCVQLVNFWPNMELEEYINLEQRVSGRMVLLDISATGEENLIDQQSGDPMNDLEYRRKQLLNLQDTVIDIEDMSSGVSITDLSLTDFRIDLAQQLHDHAELIQQLPLGAVTVVKAPDESVPAGIIFCLQAVGAAADQASEPGYPLAPYYLVHVAEDETVALPFSQVHQLLGRLKHLCIGHGRIDPTAEAAFDQATKAGEEMEDAQALLSAAVSAVTGKREERAAESLFTPGGTHTLPGDFAGSSDFEVIAMVAVLAGDDT